MSAACVGVGKGVGVSSVTTACYDGVEVAWGTVMFPLPIATFAIAEKRMIARITAHARPTCILRDLVLYHCHTPCLFPLGLIGG